MQLGKPFLPLVLVLGVAVMAGCASAPPFASVDYTAFKASRPQSILILPPVNHSPDVRASDSLLSKLTYPLAEAGYYVLPVTLVRETLRQNGVETPDDSQAISLTRLKEIFGADAVLYVTVTEYGSSYRLLESESAVAAEAKLVDLNTGNLLWSGKARASNHEGRSQPDGLAAKLISSIVYQIIDTARDASHQVAGVTSRRLLSGSEPNGVLYGPRSPNYGKDKQ